MAYDEGLLVRVREALDPTVDVLEKKMFGGVAFMLRGNMAFGIIEDELMVRVGPDAYEEALAQPHAREMDFTGRPLRGMVMVGMDGIDLDEDLRAWVARGAEFARSLPAKYEAR